jgi:DNA-binding response OmpR family regulator
MEFLMPACVLVINDELEILDLYYELLNSDEYELELSDYEFENLETIERLNPTLIILDIPVYKRGRSWRLLQQLRMHSTTATIPLILCTPSLMDVREQEEYLQKQGIVIFYHPFPPEALVQKVRQIMRRPVQRAS